MKNKTALYLLLPVAIAVWGYIIYKIIAESGTKPVLTDTKIEVGKSSSKAKLPDTFTLQLDYRDPFLGNKINDAAERPVQLQRLSDQPKVEVPVKNIAWPAITYSGRIVNKHSSKAIHLLNIAGKEYLVTEGQTVEGIKILKLAPDEVTLMLGTEKKVINK